MNPKTLLDALLVACLVAGSGCKNSEEPAAGAVSAALAPPEPPKLKVRDDSQNLSLTWVDDQGDFHVVQKVADVPASGKKQVRVVDSKSPAGTGEWVFVTDLTHKQPDGQYPVKAVARADWDEIGAKRRKTRLEALAPSAVPSSAPPPEVAGAEPQKAKGSAAGVSAIVYGADWCKPCHAAEAYLRQRGVNVVKKDIEGSEAARAEMQKKLDRAGMGGAQIPIIDVMGQLLVGYSPSALDRAIQSAAKPKSSTL